MKPLLIFFLLFSAAQAQEIRFTRYSGTELARITSNDPGTVVVTGSRDSLILYMTNKLYPFFGKVNKVVYKNQQTDFKQTEIQALQRINDSLRSKINLLLEYHSLSAPIIQELRPNGVLVNRNRYHKAIRKYYERYGKIEAGRRGKLNAKF